MDKRITLSTETVRKMKVIAAFDQQSVKRWMETMITEQVNELYVWVADDRPKVKNKKVC